MYNLGQGVPQNYAEGLKWLRHAADQGSAEGQFNLGVMYERGDGILQDYGEALKWYRLAADQGNAKGQFNLGVMYRDGKGVAKNYAETVKWFRLAADQSIALAQYNLGLMYANGLGPLDLVQAHMWLNLSAAQGIQEAGKNREIIERHMTAEQIAKARKLAGEWKPKPIQ
jgi:TPR repeat protein